MVTWKEWKSSLCGDPSPQELSALIEAMEWPGVDGARKADLWEALEKADVRWGEEHIEKLAKGEGPPSSKGWLWLLSVRTPSLETVKRWGYLNTVHRDRYTHAGRFARKAWPVPGDDGRLLSAKILAEMLVAEGEHQKYPTFSEYCQKLERILEPGVMETFLALARDGWALGVDALVETASSI